ncbi:hypothetical protein C5167_001414 [Papaver somniferum]|uniref:Aminotransferase-like plant mobile domain-containing protein n=1 Tax=Papaver somniferum TaxID=3469 RepID=A0A4Y7KZ88_PAPSO|nr:hypothetical protein C5167_001414 [Papaver somniferum]
MWESKVVNNDMEYLTDQKLSVKGIDGYTSGIDAPRMKMRTSWGSLKDYYDIVVWNSPRARQNSDVQLTNALVARWWHTNKTFHFPGFEIRLTHLDFVMLTEIPIGKGEPINYSKSRKLMDNSEVWEELTRIYLLWVIGQGFTGTTSTNASKAWLVVLGDSESLQNLEGVKQSDSGKHSMSNAKRQMDLRLSPGAVVWRPWVLNAHYRDEEVVLAREVSRKRIYFRGVVDMKDEVLYLGERCLRQVLDLSRVQSHEEVGIGNIGSSRFVPNDHWKGLAQQSFEKTDALEKLLYDRFTYGFSNTGVTSSSAFITNQSQEEASLDGTFRMLSLGGSGECIRRRQATSTLDDHGTGYHPVVMDTGISPTYSIPRLSQEENPYLNSNVNLNTDMEFVVETQVESEKAMWI